jgi:hypothetical protein
MENQEIKYNYGTKRIRPAGNGSNGREKIEKTGRVNDSKNEETGEVGEGA